MTGKGLSQLERLCIKFNSKCYWCSRELRGNSDLKPWRDHLVDFQSHKNRFSNLVLACPKCYAKRHPESAMALQKIGEVDTLLKKFGEDVRRVSLSLDKAIGLDVNKRSKRRIYTGELRAFVFNLVLLKTRGKCFYCRKPLDKVFDYVKDHYIPLIRGGADDWSNLVPSCRACDTAKGGSLPATCPEVVAVNHEDKRGKFRHHKPVVSMTSILSRSFGGKVKTKPSTNWLKMFPS